MARIQWTPASSKKQSRGKRWIIVFAALIVFVFVGLLPLVGRINLFNFTVSGSSQIEQFHAVINSGYTSLEEPIWSHKPREEINSLPVAIDDSVFLVVGNSAQNGSLRSLNFADGAENWSYKLNSVSTHEPIVFGEFIAVGDRSGTLHVLNHLTGKPIWEFQADSPVIGSAIVVKGLMYFATTYGVHCLDAETGESKWFTETGNSFSGPLQISEEKKVLSVVGNSGIYGSQLILYILDIDSGRKRLTFPLTSVSPNKPIIAGETVAISSEIRSVIAVNLLAENNPYVKTLNSLKRNAFILGLFDQFPLPYGYSWHLPVEGGLSISVLSDGRRFYIIEGGQYSQSSIRIAGDTRPSRVQSINPSDGDIVWERSLNVPLVSSGSLIDNGILLASSDGFIINLDKNSGKENWRFSTDLGILDRPIPHKGNIFVISHDNGIHAYR